ncbi:MAG TPA: hypothetical protein VNE83_06405, partial [Terriglobales bacterium]|nr:hypothetical protein [Terriglobales bacterium]
LARFWGAVLLIGGLAVVFGGVRLATAAAVLRQDRALALLLFFPVVAVGALNVAVAERWALNAAGLVTLLGWLALLMGAVGMVAPALLARVADAVTGSSIFRLLAALVLIVAGVYLLWAGYLFA